MNLSKEQAEYLIKRMEEVKPCPKVRQAAENGRKTLEAMKNMKTHYKPEQMESPGPDLEFLDRIQNMEHLKTNLCNIRTMGRDPVDEIIELVESGQKLQNRLIEALQQAKATGVLVRKNDEQDHGT